MAISMTQMQTMTTQAQKMMAKMQKARAEMQNMTTQMQKSMAEMHTQNYINDTRLAQHLQAVSGIFNAIAQWEFLMRQFYSGQTPNSLISKPMT